MDGDGPMERENMSTAQAASYLGIATKTLANNWHLYGLTVSKLGRRNVYRKVELDQYLADHAQTQPTPRVVA